MFDQTVAVTTLRHLHFRDTGVFLLLLHALCTFFQWKNEGRVENYQVVLLTLF